MPQPNMLQDQNGHPIQILTLSAPQRIDGTSASAKSAAITTNIVRICALDALVYFLIGADPAATNASHSVPANTDIYQPIVPGQKVAIFGGIAIVSDVS